MLLRQEITVLCRAFTSDICLERDLEDTPLLSTSSRLKVEQDFEDTPSLSTSLRLKVSGALLCFYVRYLPGAGL